MTMTMTMTTGADKQTVPELPVSDTVSLTHYDRDTGRITLRCKRCGAEWTRHPSVLHEPHRLDVCPGGCGNRSARRVSLEGTMCGSFLVGREVDPPPSATGRIATNRRRYEVTCSNCGGLLVRSYAAIANRRVRCDFCLTSCSPSSND